MEGTLLNIVKAIYQKTTAGIIPNLEKLKAFALRSGTGNVAPLTTSIQCSAGSTCHRK